MGAGPSLAVPHWAEERQAPNEPGVVRDDEPGTRDGENRFRIHLEYADRDLASFSDGLWKPPVPEPGVPRYLLEYRENSFV
jgi:hypothetical protein